MASPSPADIAAAATRIAPHAVHTPLIENQALNDLVGGRVFLKLECLQRIGAFKFRGAMNGVAQIDRARHPGGVVACSSGNHAQGIAEAARIAGMPATIVMPHDAPRAKVDGVHQAGGEIVGYDRAGEDRDAIARALARERAAAFLPPYDHAHIIAGQGTVGLEIIAQSEQLGAAPDVVLVPCSGGGLISGVAIAVLDSRPGADVFAVEPEGFDDMARSLASGRRVANRTNTGSICDALLSVTPGELTFEICRDRLAGGLAVSDNAALEAMRFAFEHLKIVTEPSGVVALAALLAGGVDAAGRVTVVVISGGNVDGPVFARAIAGASGP